MTMSIVFSIENTINRHNAYERIWEKVVRGECCDFFVDMIEKYVSFDHNRVIRIRSIIEMYDDYELINVIRNVYYCAEDCDQQDQAYTHAQKIVAYVKTFMKT